MSDSYVDQNREAWTGYAADFAATAEGEWAAADPVWGIVLVPESEVGMFPPDVAEMDTIELGCGKAYVSAWLAKRGARPKGVDVTPAQLETARRCQEETGIVFPLVEASA